MQHAESKAPEKGHRPSSKRRMTQEFKTSYDDSDYSVESSSESDLDDRVFE